MKREIRFTGSFRKDLKLAKRQGRNIEKLFEVIGILADGGILEERYRDHGLSGQYSDVRECHIESDWLLIYQIVEDSNVLVLDRIGTHSELFR